MVIKAKSGELPPSRAGSLAQIGGALALDFANTASGRGTEKAQDHLRTPIDLVTWARHAGAVDAATADRLQRLVDPPAPGFRTLLEDALSLREAIYGAAAALAKGGRPSAGHLGVIKDLCARAIAAASLEAGAEGFSWVWPKEPPTPETLLGPIAMSAVGVIRDGDLTRVKQCKGEYCGWVFFDLTKNRSRRWCEMSVCGNRAKAKRFAATRVDSGQRPQPQRSRRGT